MSPLQVSFEDARLEPIRRKVEACERLSFEDGVTLYRSPDLLGVGWMANRVRERLHGNATFFNVNRHINPTDVCVANCRLCAFGKRAKDPKSYTMSLEQVWEVAGHGYTEAVTEFHIVGGLHPELTLDWYCQMLRGLKERFPQVHLKAFTMVEIGYLAQRAKLSAREVLERLKAAGMDSLPGGGAEIFSDRVRRIICDHKITGDQWLDVARTAHQLGLHSNCTMLYGHIETEEDRVDHLLKLRGLQDETGGFVTFIPLAFHPDNTALDHISKTTGFDDLRQIAVSRLLLDNIAHVKAYWIMMTPRIAQIAQRFGSDDIDGTVVEEKIYHDAGATTSQNLRRGELLRLIREAGRDPVERDTLYRPVERVENAFTVLV
ncbi:MAG TPA: aminofutalosine synthase MqnE [Bryobacteraceae bacterium]|nr:aminofutalosine synthase MqnE [Bryobacteraceae bacterium]